MGGKQVSVTLLRTVLNNEVERAQRCYKLAKKKKKKKGGKRFLAYLEGRIDVCEEILRSIERIT